MASSAIHALPELRRAPAPRAFIVLIGFTAIVAQVVLLREMLTICQGNELSLGFVLAAWLAWTAAGSGLLGDTGSSRRTLAVLFSISAAALPIALVILRHARSWWGVTPGEMLAPAAILITALAALAVFCPFSGWLMAAAMRAGAARLPATDVAGRAYLLEALGSAIGGLVAALLLLRHLSPLQIVALLAALNALAACFLLSASRLLRIAAAGGVAIALLLFLPQLRSAELRAIARDWPGFRVAAWQESRYGRLAVVENEGTATLLENGQPLFTAPDLRAAEEAVHFALLQVASPRSVLLIGGGPGGAIAEILKHPSIARLDYVELDPAVIDLARRFLPRPSSALSDPRVSTHAVDGRLFLRSTLERYDVILVNLPEPHTAQLNRFYTLEFFRDAAAHLAPAGVVSFQVRGAENYVSPELGRFLASLRRTLAAAFPQVTALPGDAVHFFAGGKSAQLTSDPAELARRLAARGVSTQYVRGYYTAFDFSPERRAGFDARLAAIPGTRINRDLAPSAYFFDIVLWSGQFGAGYRAAFAALAAIPTLSLAGLVLLIAMLLALAARPGRCHPGRPAAYAVALMGFTLMAVQLLLLLGFQAVYGYVFEQVALLTAACMAGLGLGSWLALKSPGKTPSAVRLLTLQVVAAAAAPVSVALLRGFAAVGSHAMLAFAAWVVFPGISLLSGIMAGMQFPPALRMFLPGALRGPGALYAFDLLGSCAGALLLSTYLVPVFGFATTAALVALANLPAIALLLLSSRPPVAAR